MSSFFPKGSHAAISSEHIEGGNNTEYDTKSSTKSKEICNNNNKNNNNNNNNQSRTNGPINAHLTIAHV